MDAGEIGHCAVALRPESGLPSQQARCEQSRNLEHPGRQRPAHRDAPVAVPEQLHGAGPPRRQPDRLTGILINAGLSRGWGQVLPVATSVEAHDSKCPHPGARNKTPEECLVGFEASGLSPLSAGAPAWVSSGRLLGAQKNRAPHCLVAATGSVLRKRAPPGANNGQGFPSIRLLNQPSRCRLNRPGVHRVQAREDADLFG